jgi:hypothetical protein
MHPQHYLDFGIERDWCWRENAVKIVGTKEGGELEDAK